MNKNHCYVVESFEDTVIGEIFTYGEIIYTVKLHFPNATKGSIIPSDYCYNRMNKGLTFSTKLNLFEYLDEGRYKYLGINYNYSGTVMQRERGSIGDTIYGEWVNGSFVRSK